MNILFVFNQFPGLGGVETVSDNLISYLGDYFKIFTVSLYSDSSMPLNDKVEKAFLLPEDDSRKAGFYNSLVKDLEISCVINQGIYPVLHPVVFNSDRDRSVKVISVLHGMPGYEKLMFWQKKSIRRSPRWLNMLRRQWCAKGKYPRYYKFIRPFAESYRTAAIEGDMVVLLTSGYERQFIREYGLEQYASKICSIENPLPSGFSMYGEPDWSEKKDMILFVGRLSIEKRVWIVLDMWRKVGKKVGWTLFVVGDGYEGKRLRKIARNLQNVSFEGYVSHPEKYYREAKILVLTSEFEGFPMTLIEAQRFGTVPVSYEVSAGVSAILSDGGGVAVPKDNFDALCDAVSGLMDDPVRLRQMSEDAFRKSSEYSIDRIGLRWKTLIEETVSR